MNDDRIEELNKKITELENRLEIFEVLLEPCKDRLQKYLNDRKGKVCFKFTFLY